jgi:NADH-quinone oxidoreductase E subunit
MAEQKEFSFTKINLAISKEVVTHYPEGRQASAVLPLLDLAQRQIGGWLTKEAMDYVAKTLDMAPIRVYEVASFYTMFNLEPVGKYRIQVCGTTPCWLRGAEEIMNTCKKELGIEKGQTTKDGMFTLTEVECLCACVNSPVVAINDDYYEDLDSKSISKIISDLKQNKKVKYGSQIGRHSSEPKED